MSLARAVEAPRRPSVERPLRRIEIVTTRAQRRARPRIVYAVVAVAGVFTIFIAQLLLSIAVSNGAYNIATLQSEKAALARTEQSLTEKAAVLASPQNLDRLATAQGMAPGSAAMARLDLKTGTVTGTAQPVTAPDAASSSTDGTDDVPNALLGDAPPSSDANGPGAPETQAAATHVASENPPPVTTH